jgi:hypothetical protein
MADVDAALEQKILNVAQAEREPHAHHDHEPDHLRRRIETAKRVAGVVISLFYQRPTPPAILV